MTYGAVGPGVSTAARLRGISRSCPSWSLRSGLTSLCAEDMTLYVSLPSVTQSLPRAVLVRPFRLGLRTLFLNAVMIRKSILPLTGLLKSKAPRAVFPWL